MKDSKNKMFTPFSNGTEAMIWYGDNCEKCVKAYFPKDCQYPSEKTMKHYCRIGKECKLKYALDLAFIISEIPESIASVIGMSKNGGLKETCMMFSDNNDDGFKYPERPKPDNTPDNQLMLPILLNDIQGDVKEKKNKKEELDRSEIYKRILAR